MSKPRRGDTVGYPKTGEHVDGAFKHRGKVTEVYTIDDDTPLLLRIEGLAGVVPAGSVTVLDFAAAGDRCLDPSWCGGDDGNGSALICINCSDTKHEGMLSQPLDKMLKPALESPSPEGGTWESVTIDLGAPVETEKIKVTIESPAITEQPAPIPNPCRPSWETVIDDMHQRDHMGRAKYGTPLQPDNGRDALVDLYQELLDACVYVRQEISERELRENRERDVLEWISIHGCGQLDNGTQVCADGTHVKGCAAEMAISVLEETKK